MSTLQEFFKKVFRYIFRKKWVILISCLILWIWWYYWYKYFNPEKPQIDYMSNDHIVKKWTLQKALHLAWTTQFANAQKLTFASQNWRVTNVNVKVWDAVKKWQTLATMSTDNLDKEIEDLKRTLKNAQQSYQEELEKWDSNYEIQKTESDLNLLVSKRETLPTELEIKTQEKASNITKQTSNIKLKEVEIKKKEKELKDKQKDLEDIQKDYEKIKSWDKSELISTPEQTRKWNETMWDLIKEIKTQSNNLQDLLYNYDKVVKVSSNYTPDEKNIYLWAKNQNKMNQSIQKYWDVLSYVEKLNKIYEEYSKMQLDKITKDQLLKSYSIFTQLWNELREWWKINIEAFWDSIETLELSKDTINNLVKEHWRWLISKWDDYIKLVTDTAKKLADMKSVLSPEEELKEKVENTKNDVDKLQIELLELQNSLVSLQSELTQKELEYKLSKQQNDVELATKDKEIKDKRKELEDLRKWTARKKNLDAKRDAIESAQWALTTKMKEYDNYKIISNFDWVVTKVNVQVWDSIWWRNSWSSDDKYIYVETPDLLEVKLEVDQLDITKIQLWMDVDVSIDAFEWTVNKWKFSEIDTMPENNAYKSKVVFKKANEKEKIFWWMSANVKVTLESQKDVLLVPNSAIAENEQWQKIVRYQDKQTKQWSDKVVETWMSDEAQTVITSWLQEWDVIKWLYMNEQAMNNLWIWWWNLTPWAWWVQTSEDWWMFYQAW